MSRECPQVVAEAMMQVQKAVQKLDHDSTNDFNNYGYVSIDGYYDAIRPMLNEAELMIIPNEVDAVVMMARRRKSFSSSSSCIHLEPLGASLSGALYTSNTQALNLAERRSVTQRSSSSEPCSRFRQENMTRTKGRIEEVEEMAQITHDADSTKSPKSGEEVKIDFDYEGAPFPYLQRIRKHQSSVHRHSDMGNPTQNGR